MAVGWCFYNINNIVEFCIWKPSLQNIIREYSWSSLHFWHQLLQTKVSSSHGEVFAKMFCILHLFNIGQKPSKYMWILSLPLKLKVSCLELCLLWTLVWIFFKDFPHKGLLKTFKKSAGWTINKFWLNNSVAITGTILRSAYKEIDIQRRTFSNFWNFYCSYYQIIAVWILLSEGRDKKGAFVEISSSKYSILKSKMQGIFRPCFGSHRIK